MLYNLITQTEKLLNENTTSTTSSLVDEAVVEGLVKDFASSWRTGIQQINDDVLAYFANFRNGMDILKQVLYWNYCTVLFVL